jgi:hypothetical protein
MKLGGHQSEETKTKLSAAMKGKKNRLGYRCSAETRAKMSAVKVGHIGYWLGKHRYAETRVKMSAAMKGNAYALGCHHTEEAKEKQSVAGMGFLNHRWKGGVTPEKIKEWKRKANAKRRALGYVYLNSWFSGSEGHHINESDVIFIPKEMHHSIYHNHSTGQGMAEMNALAGQFLTEDWT